MANDLLSTLMQGARFGQEMRMNQLKMAQMQNLAPLQQRLAELRIEEAQGAAQAQVAAQAQRERELAQKQALLLGRVSSRALEEKDPEMKQMLLSGGLNSLANMGFDVSGIDPATITDEELVQNVATAKLFAPAGKFAQATGKGMQGYVFNESTGTYHLDEATRNTAINTQRMLASKPALSVSDISSINKDATAILKGPQKMVTATQELVNLEANASPAAKTAAVIKFMKVLDPDSVVSTTEQGIVFSGQGLPEQVKGVVNNALGYGKLTDAGFNDIVNTSKVMANTVAESAKAELDNYLSVFGELSPDRREKIMGRVPKSFKVDAGTTGGTDIVSKYHALPPEVQATLLPQLSEEEKILLGIVESPRREIMAGRRHR